MNSKINLFIFYSVTVVLNYGCGGGEEGTGEGNLEVVKEEVGGGEEGTGRDINTGLPVLVSQPVSAADLPSIHIKNIKPPQWLRGQWKLSKEQNPQSNIVLIGESEIDFRTVGGKRVFGSDNARISITQNDQNTFGWKIDYYENNKPYSISYDCSSSIKASLICSYSNTIDDTQVTFSMTRL